MSADWPEFQLGERCSVKSSKRIFAKEYVENGVPFFRSKDVIDKSFGTFTGYDLFISEARYKEIKETHGSPRKGDVLISSVGNRSGQPYVVQDEGDFYFKDGNILWFSEFDDINPDYLAYWFKSGIGQGTLASVMIGSAQKALTIDSIRKLWVKFPSIEYQNKAAVVLKTLDDKIELNRQTNQTLEQIAQAIFKSWFVDFEPVKAKIQAKRTLTPTLSQRERELVVERAAMCAISGKSLEELEQLSPETQQQLKTTAALFPDALVESELGEIPEGWDASKLGEHFNVVMGQSPKGDTYNEEGNGILFFQGRRDFGFRFPTPRVYTTDPKRFAQAGDTLISVRAPVGDKNMALEECCLGRGVAGIRHKSGSRSFTYSFISYIENNLSNSGSDGTVFNSINKNELHAVPFVAPNAMLVNLYEKLLYSIDQNLEVLSKEIESFEQLRDTLLPKLLSGELTLSPTAIKEKEAIGLSNA
jgi:type I restriction enzyme S subunit